jgi:hypothetical protein
MFCPKCGAEYRPEFRECADCGVALVASPPESVDQERESSELVTIFESSDPALVAMAESLLESAEIPFSKDEAMQEVFGSVMANPVVFQVDGEDVDEARALLEGLDASASPVEDEA